MNLKMMALFAVAAAAPVPALAQINTPVPANFYITFGGHDWAWASPCPATTGWGCGSDVPVDLSYQGTLGWRLPTAAELAMGPVASDFLDSTGSTICASAYFTSAYTWCDYGDAAGGAVFGSAGGGNWYDETWVIRDVSGVPEPAAWGMMIGGFGLAGMALRRRTTKVAFAA
jgi:hypothetical protein